MKRILIFSFAYYPNLVGGAEVAVKEITDRISSNEIVFDMVTILSDRSTPRREKIGNVNIYRVGSGFKWMFPLCKLLFPIIAFLKAVSLDYKNNYSAIWSIMANRAGFSALFFKTFYPKTKFILTLQEGDTLDYPEERMGILKPILKPVFKKIFTKADTIQAISNYLADWARSMGAKGDVLVIPNGVDVSNFSKKYSEDELKKLNSSKEDKIIITTSRLVKKNAVDDVIKALVYLPEKYKFVVIGAGPDIDKLKALADSELVAHRVMFLGHIDQKEIPKYLKASDIFIRPSLSEGMGNSFIEAMAAEIPVIATPVGGIVDFLFDPENGKGLPPTGIFCKVGDPKDIAGQILRIEENSRLKEEIVKNAKALVLEKYDWGMIASNMEKIINV